MFERFLASVVAAALAFALTPAPEASQTASRRPTPRNVAASKTWTLPRTPDGQPDMQGVWINNSATPLERPAELAGRAALSDDEVAELKRRAARLFSDVKNDFAGGDDFFLAALANPERFRNPQATGSALNVVEREFDNRTSLITEPSDGRIPFTPAGRQQQTAHVFARQHPNPAGPEDLPTDLRCITAGVPRLGGNAASYNNYYQILQTPGYVVLVGEVIHDARIIPLDARPHVPTGVRQWHGDSRGRWEGNTLVVDTVNFSSKSFFIGSSEHLHLVERFTLVDADTITYEITVDDSTTWTTPWTAVVRMKHSQDRMYEYACHEGNSHTMVGILAGTRAEENAAAKTGPPK